MKTSKEFSKCLKNGVVTLEMLSEAIFSYNKRAKNARDKARDYRHASNFYNYKWENIERYDEIKESYYKRKEELLSYLTPQCVHVVEREHYTKVYDYEPEYKKIDWDDVIRENCYYDYEENREVWFKVIGELFKEYYIFYDLGKHSYHTPIKSPKEYPNLPIEDIGDLETFGEETSELMSVQMADKIRKGLAEGTLKLETNNEQKYNNQNETGDNQTY